MSEELYFNNELRKCLDAAGLSDCGENDVWNYWYQRVHKAHDQAIDRVTEVQRAESAKLRELACHMLTCIRYMESPAFDENGCSFCKYDGKRVCNFEERMKALDIEAEE